MHSHAGAIVGPEPLRPEFSESLFAMLDRVFRAGSERSMRTDYPFFFREENFANLFICRLGGRVLTHLGLLPVTLSYFGHPIRVGMIGGVATDPDFREQGLATRTLREVLSHCRRIGGELVMISGGRGLYLRHGARSVGKFDQYVLELNYAAQPGVRLERCGPRHASIMSTLHRQKPFRFVRPLEEWRLNVGAGRCQGRPSDYWLVRRGEEASAYFAFPDRAQDARGVCELREWGGQVEDIIAALPQVGRAAGCKGVLWRLYPHETRARRAIEAAGARGAGPTAVQGTARVVNADALMASLAGYVAEVLGAEVARRLELRTLDGERFRIRYGTQEMTVRGHGGLTRLLFGEGLEALPGSLAPGPLRDALQALLPLPIAQFDMTYA